MAEKQKSRRISDRSPPRRDRSESPKSSRKSKDKKKKQKKPSLDIYWNGEGKYQADHDRLWKAFVPASGKCATNESEMFRLINRFYYDLYNNGKKG